MRDLYQATCDEPIRIILDQGDVIADQEDCADGPPASGAQGHLAVPDVVGEQQ